MKGAGRDGGAGRTSRAPRAVLSGPALAPCARSAVRRVGPPRPPPPDPSRPRSRTCHVSDSLWCVGVGVCACVRACSRLRRARAHPPRHGAPPPPPSRGVSPPPAACSAAHLQGPRRPVGQHSRTALRCQAGQSRLRPAPAPTAAPSAAHERIRECAEPFSGPLLLPLWRRCGPLRLAQGRAGAPWAPLRPFLPGIPGRPVGPAGPGVEGTSSIFMDRAWLVAWRIDSTASQSGPGCKTWNRRRQPGLSGQTLPSCLSRIAADRGFVVPSFRSFPWFAPVPALKRWPAQLRIH